MVAKMLQEYFPIECPNYIRVCFGFALLRSVIVIALGTGCMYLPRVLIGSLCCLRLLRLARMI